MSTVASIDWEAFREFVREKAGADPIGHVAIDHPERCAIAEFLHSIAQPFVCVYDDSIAFDPHDYSAAYRVRTEPIPQSIANAINHCIATDRNTCTWQDVHGALSQFA